MLQEAVASWGGVPVVADPFEGTVSYDGGDGFIYASNVGNLRALNNCGAGITLDGQLFWNGEAHDVGGGVNFLAKNSMLALMTGGDGHMYLLVPGGGDGYGGGLPEAPSFYLEQWDGDAGDYVAADVDEEGRVVAPAGTGFRMWVMLDEGAEYLDLDLPDATVTDDHASDAEHLVYVDEEGNTWWGWAFYYAGSNSELHDDVSVDERSNGRIYFDDYRLVTMTIQGTGGDGGWSPNTPAAPTWYLESWDADAGAFVESAVQSSGELGDWVPLVPQVSLRLWVMLDAGADTLDVALGNATLTDGPGDLSYEDDDGNTWYGWEFHFSAQPADTDNEIYLYESGGWIAYFNHYGLLDVKMPAPAFYLEKWDEETGAFAEASIWDSQLYGKYFNIWQDTVMRLWVRAEPAAWDLEVYPQNAEIITLPGQDLANLSYQDEDGYWWYAWVFTYDLDVVERDNYFLVDEYVGDTVLFENTRILDARPPFGEQMLMWAARDALNAVDNNPNAGAGKRYFPDKYAPDESGPRNVLDLVVRMPADIPNATVYLRVFDVDDPTPADYDGGTVDPNLDGGDDNRPDYLGVTGGFLVNGNIVDWTTVTLDENARAVVPFQVGMQPGNNYRVGVAVAGQEGPLFDDLQVSDSSSHWYVRPGNDPITGFAGYRGLSPMLTVWRKLHLEFDKMADGPPNSGDEVNAYTGGIYSYEGLTENTSRLYLDSALPGANTNRYENGTIWINGFGNFEIISSTENPASRGILTIAGTPGANVTSKLYVVHDDDDQFLTELGLPQPLAEMPNLGNIVTALNGKYNPAYIQIINANGGYYLSGEPLNPNQDIPFRLNEHPANVFGYNMFEQYKDVNDEPAFWAHTVVFAYQDDGNYDADPSSEVAHLGGTPKQAAVFNFASRGFSVIYMETIRDNAFSGLSQSDMQGFINSGNPIGPNTYKGNYFSYLDASTAHEIGHAPGAQTEEEDHNEQGLMTASGPTMVLNFKPITIRRFRTTTTWSR